MRPCCRLVGQALLPQGLRPSVVFRVAAAPLNSVWASTSLASRPYSVRAAGQAHDLSLSFGSSPVCLARRLLSTTKPSKRDPDAPKKVLGAFLRFMKDYRLKNPTLKGKVAATSGGVEWKAMSMADKCPWQEPYEKEQEEYKKQMQSYADSGKQEAWKRDPERPKIPATPFIKFTSEYRSKNANLKKVTEVTKASGEAWKGMSAAEKAPYEAGYAEAKLSFAQTMKEYKASGKEKLWQDKVGITAAVEEKQAAAEKVKEKANAVKNKAQAAAEKGKAKAKRDPDAPKRPATAYLRFMKDFRQKKPAVKGKVAIKSGSVEWKGLSDSDKKPYVEAYESEKAEYLKEVAKP